MLTQHQPNDRETELSSKGVAKSASKLTSDSVLLSSNNTHVESSEESHRVNDKEHDSGTLSLRISGGPLRDNPVSQDTARPLIGHANNGVHSQEIVKDEKKVIGLSPSTAAKSAVAANDRTCSVKEPTQLPQEAT